MVDKKGMIEKKNFLSLFGILIFSSFIIFVIATTVGDFQVLGSPQNYTNWSGTMNVTCPAGNITNATNATIYYNLSGGPITFNVTYILGNTTNVTGNATYLWVNSSNGLLNISGFSDSLNYNITCVVQNATGNKIIYAAVTNVTIDNTPPLVSFSGITNTINNGNSSGVIVLNVSVTDATMGVESVYFNITNSSGTQLNFTKALSLGGGYYNISLNTVGFIDGKYNITVWANDTKLNNLNNTGRIQITVDNTAPGASYSCLPSPAFRGETVTCTCGPSDVLSGINGSATALISSPSTSSTGTYTVTCTYADLAGNGGSISTTYEIQDIPAPTTLSPGGGSSAPVTKISSFSEIVPGTPATITGFATDSGVSQIEIEVGQTASNVKVTIDKYESKPAAVSVDKPDTYKYLHFTTINLADKLSKATLKIQVNKSWVSSQNIQKTDVALFRYDNSTSSWNVLTTKFNSEDTNYYYYTIDLTSFSYFAISSNVQQSSNTQGTNTNNNQTGQTTPTNTGLFGLPYLGWIIIGIVILAIIIWVGISLGKKKK